MLTFKQLQDEHIKWVEHNFPRRDRVDHILGAMEELGELAHAHLKMRLGIRGSHEEKRAQAADAVGDVIIFLCGYCSDMGFNLQEIMEKTWDKVKQRDWIVDPMNGRAP